MSEIESNGKIMQTTDLFVSMSTSDFGILNTLPDIKKIYPAASSRFACIYSVINKLTGEMYIGSTKDFYNRICGHIWHFKNNIHQNSRMQNVFNKYGKDIFMFDVLEMVYDENLLILLEQKLINFFNPEYNICKIAKSRLGVKMSDESRAKMRLSKLNQSPETKRKISETLKGNKISEEVRAKMSKALKGKKKTKEHSKKISEGLKKYKRTEEHTKNLLSVHLNNKHALGIKPSEATREKISLGIKNHYIEKRKNKDNGKTS